MSNLNITTLNKHIYGAERPKGRLQAALGFKWTANGRKEPKSKHTVKGESDTCHFQCTTSNFKQLYLLQFFPNSAPTGVVGKLGKSIFRWLKLEWIWSYCLEVVGQNV